MPASRSNAVHTVARHTHHAIQDVTDVIWCRYNVTCCGDLRDPQHRLSVGAVRRSTAWSFPSPWPGAARREPLAVALHRLAAKAHAEGLVILDDLGAAPFACRVTSSREGHAPYIVNLTPGPLHGCQCQGYANSSAASITPCVWKRPAGCPICRTIRHRGRQPPSPCCREPSVANWPRPISRRAFRRCIRPGRKMWRPRDEQSLRSGARSSRTSRNCASCPDGGSERVPSCWGPPRLRILSDERERWVQEAADTLLADPDIHICAVSPAAAVAGSARSASTAASQPASLYPHFVITVIYQERVKPADRAGRYLELTSRQRELAALPS